MTLVSSTNWGEWSSALGLGVNDPYILEITLTSMRDSDISLTFQCSTPETVTETPAQSKFNNVSIQGRTDLFYFDSVNNRTLTFPLKLSADNIVAGNGGQIDTLTEAINYLKAMATPQYTSSGIVPNYIYCQIGDQFTIKGTLQIGALKWGLPIRDGHYCTVDTSITITEVRDESLSSDDYLDGAEYEIEDI